MCKNAKAPPRLNLGKGVPYKKKNVYAVCLFYRFFAISPIKDGKTKKIIINPKPQQ